jgi:hypothetical protein
MKPLAESGRQFEDSIVRHKHYDIAGGIQDGGADFASLQVPVDFGAQLRIHLAVDVG